MATRGGPVLIAILVPAVNAARNSAKNVKTGATLRAIETALEMFKTDNGSAFSATGGYPPSFSHPKIHKNFSFNSWEGPPMVVLVGRDDKHFLQAHTADDIAGIVRPFTKWDAHPETLEEALDAIQEAYRQAITPPCAPTVVILDTEVQKEEAGDLEVPAYRPPTIPAIRQQQADGIAMGLLAARNPHISVGRMRTRPAPTGLSNWLNWLAHLSPLVPRGVP